MQQTHEEILALLEPLTHKRIGKIDYTPENFEKYWTVLATFGFIADQSIRATEGELCHFFAKALHGKDRKWYLPRGKIQSISYKCNRIEDNSRRVIKRFSQKTDVQWVWRVREDSRWGDQIGYVISTLDEAAAKQVARMMYHTAASVEVERVKPLFDLGIFLSKQQAAKEQIRKEILKSEKAIEQYQKNIKVLEEKLCDIVTNSVCFAGDNS
jgi:hypothetical protein